MPKLKRQNAFTEEQPEPFIKYQCRICHEYEAYGEWVLIKCDCNAEDDYSFCHLLCLNRAKECKICRQSYSRKQRVINHTTQQTLWIKRYQHILNEKMRMIKKYKIPLLITVAAGIVFLMFYNLCSCITIDKVSREELKGLSDADYLWLPRFHRKCFQSTTSSLLFRIYIFCIIFIALYIKYLKDYGSR